MRCIKTVRVRPGIRYAENLDILFEKLSIFISFTFFMLHFLQYKYYQKSNNTLSVYRGLA